MDTLTNGETRQLDLEAVFRESHIGEVLDGLERELIGLEPVKSRIDRKSVV